MIKVLLLILKKCLNSQYDFIEDLEREVYISNIIDFNCDRKSSDVLLDEEVKQNTDKLEEDPFFSNNIYINEYFSPETEKTSRSFFFVQSDIFSKEEVGENTGKNFTRNDFEKKNIQSDGLTGEKEVFDTHIYSGASVSSSKNDIKVFKRVNEEKCDPRSIYPFESAIANTSKKIKRSQEKNYNSTESSAIPCEINNYKPKINEVELQKKQSKRNITNDNMFKKISDSNHNIAINFIVNLHRSIKDVIFENCQRNYLEAKDLRMELLKKIYELKNEGLKSDEQLNLHLEFAKSIICFEKRFMKNFSIEEKNSILLGFKLKSFDENMKNLSRYCMLGEIPFFIHSYNKGMIHLKKDCMIYVGFMFILFEVYYLNIDSFIGLKNQFCIEYNSLFFNLRLILYKMLLGIERFDSKKHFYIVISSLVYFSNIGGIYKSLHKKKIYCLTLNILLRSVFLCDFTNKETCEVMDFFNLKVLDRKNSLISLAKILFLLFFSHFNNMSLIQNYIEIYYLMKKKMHFIKINSEISEIFEDTRQKVENYDRYESKGLNQIEDLFTLEAFASCLDSKLVYYHIKLRDTFYYSYKKNFIKRLNSTLMNFCNQ